VSVSAKEVLEEEESCVAPPRGRVDGTLVVNAEGFGRQVSVYTRSGSDGLTIAFGESACGAVDSREHFVDAGGCELRVEACPGGVEERCGHIFA